MERSAIHLQKQIKQKHNSQINHQSNPEEQTKINKKITSTKFIPFTNERDSIGRLIKNSSTNFESNANKNQKKPTFKKSLSLTPFNHTKNSESTLNAFFKENSVYKKSSPQKIKIHRRPSLQQYMLKPQNVIKVNLNASKDEQEQTIQQHHYTLGKSQSLQCKKFDEISIINKQKSLKTKYRLALNIKPIISDTNTGRKLQKMALTTNFSQHDGNVYNLQKLKKLKSIDLQLKNVKGKVNQCQELERYREMKKLRMNLFNDINDGHNFFLKKMQQSKQLAYKIKKGLQV